MRRRTVIAGLGVALTVLSVAILAGSSNAREASLGNGCIKSTTPDLKDVGRHYVKFTYEYKDECFFSAATAAELRRGDGRWERFSQTTTTATRGNERITRELKIDGLERERNYDLRSAIDYVVDTDTSDRREFRTDFQRARDLKLAVEGGGRTIGPEFRALTSPYGRNVAKLQWGRTTDYANSDDLPARECVPAGNGRDRCKWLYTFVVRDNVERGDPPQFLEAGQRYHARIKLVNPVYNNVFGFQRTEDVSFVAGERFRIEVGEAG